MRKLVTLVLALVLLGAATAATAATMSCFVDTAAYDKFTVGRCFAQVPAKYATAVFRVDPPLPENFEVWWEGDRADSPCYAYSSVCTVRIQAFVPRTVTARVFDWDNFTFFVVSATASFETGQ